MFKHLVVSLALLVDASSAIAQNDSLVAALRRNRYPMQISANGISGPGAELIIRSAREAQFTLIGEEHGVALVPRLTNGLFRALVPYGYRHVAIETSEVLAARVQHELRTGDHSQYIRFLTENRPAVPFYMWNDDAAFIRSAVRLLPRTPDALWGLDYDITGDRVAFRRLRSLARTPQARVAMDSVIKQGDAALAAALRKKNPGMLMMWGGAVDVYDKLDRAFPHATKDAEARGIIHVLRETRMINDLFAHGQNYESNLRRSKLMKSQFMKYYNAAKQREGSDPKVLLKFGASHMYRGLSATNIFDIGTMVSEIAATRGRQSFHIFAFGGVDSEQAVLDPTVFRSVAQPTTLLDDGGLKALKEANDPNGVVVFDLRPLREINQRRGFGNLTDRMSRLLYAFDVIVVLNRTEPQKDLVP